VAIETPRQQAFDAHPKKLSTCRGVVYAEEILSEHPVSTTKHEQLEDGSIVRKTIISNIYRAIIYVQSSSLGFLHWIITISL
jgi:hypothetical protein